MKSRLHAVFCIVLSTLFLLQVQVSAKKKRKEKETQKKEEVAKSIRQEGPQVIPEEETEVNTESKLPFFEDFDTKGLKNDFKKWLDLIAKETKTKKRQGIEIRNMSDYCDHWIKHPYFEDSTHIKTKWVEKLKILLADMGKARSIWDLAEKRGWTQRQKQAEDYYDSFQGKLEELIKKPDKLTKDQIRLLKEKRKREANVRKRQKRNTKKTKKRRRKSSD